MIGWVNLIRQEKDGKWLVKCDICSWKTLEQTQKKAENKLANHLNTVHREGRKWIQEQRPVIPPGEMPPNIPTPVKERGSDSG